MNNVCGDPLSLKLQRGEKSAIQGDEPEGLDRAKLGTARCRVKEGRGRKRRGDEQEPDKRCADLREERARNREDPNHQGRRFINPASSVRNVSHLTTGDLLHAWAGSVTTGASEL